MVLVRVTAMLALAGCIEPALATGSAERGVEVGSLIDEACSTEVVLPLSFQIAEEAACLAPDALTSFSEGPGVSFESGAVIPYATFAARSDLAAAADAGADLLITSAYRTVVQQLLLRRWFEAGRCDVFAAALPGRSNHESGRAIDVGNFADVAGVLPDHGWEQTVDGDPVHFDHLASPDYRGYDVRGFQRLWNRNHPAEPIGEDGVYGPETEMALLRAPSDGFAEAGCSPSDLDAELLAFLQPDVLVAGGPTAEVRLRFRNTGDVTWPAGTTLATAIPTARDSVLYDPATWQTPRVITRFGDAVPPGGEVIAVFDVRAGDELGGLVVENFQLHEPDGRSFGPAVKIDVYVEAVAGGPAGGGDDGEMLDAGCSSGGSRGGLAGLLVALALVGLRRRRDMVA